MSRTGGTRAVRKLAAGATAALVAAAGLAAPVGAAPVGTAAVPAPVPATGADARATDQIIVKYAAGATPVVADVEREAGEKVGLKGRTSDGSVVVKLPGKRSGASVAATSRRIAALPGVEYAEPDTILFPAAVPTDPRYGEQWDLSAPAAPAAGSTLFGANLQPAWDTTMQRSGIFGNTGVMEMQQN